MSWCYLDVRAEDAVLQGGDAGVVQDLLCLHLVSHVPVKAGAALQKPGACVPTARHRERPLTVEPGLQKPGARVPTARHRERPLTAISSGFRNRVPAYRLPNTRQLFITVELRDSSQFDDTERHDWKTHNLGVIKHSLHPNPTPYLDLRAISVRNRCLPCR